MKRSGIRQRNCLSSDKRVPLNLGRRNEKWNSGVLGNRLSRKDIPGCLLASLGQGLNEQLPSLLGKELRGADRLRYPWTCPPRRLGAAEQSGGNQSSVTSERLRRVLANEYIAT